MVRRREGLTMPPGRRIPRPGPAPLPKSDPPEYSDLPPELLKAGGELTALAAEIKGCTQCGRTGECVMGTGFPRAKIMLLREAPTESDLKSGLAFIDEASALELAFSKLGLGPVYGSTAVRCGTGKPSLDELKACATHLLVEIEAVSPRVVVVFGESTLGAVRYLDGRCGIVVPELIEAGEVCKLKESLVLLLTESLPEGLESTTSKRILWKHLQLLPGLI